MLALASGTSSVPPETAHSSVSCRSQKTHPSFEKMEQMKVSSSLLHFESKAKGSKVLQDAVTNVAAALHHHTKESRI